MWFLLALKFFSIACVISSIVIVVLNFRSRIDRQLTSWVIILLVLLIMILLTLLVLVDIFLLGGIINMLQLFGPTDSRYLPA